MAAESLLASVRGGLEFDSSEAVGYKTLNRLHWPNGWEGGYVNGHDEVRNYWTRQWKELNPKVEPVKFSEKPGGQLEVEVHQLVKDLQGNILFDGMDGWLDYATNTPDKPAVKWTRSINYDLLPADEFNKMIAGKKDFALIDVRTKDEFANTSKNYWQNIGQVKNSVNIPFAELKTSVSLPASKALQVIVYGFNSQPEIFESAKWLKDQGYKNVSILQGGIWSLRWTSHNIKGKAYLNDLVVNVPAENQ